MPIPKLQKKQAALLKRIDEARAVKKVVSEAPAGPLDTQYIPGNVIGSGSYGEVFEAVDTRSGETVAIKKLILKSDPVRRQKQLHAIEREVHTLSTLRHPHIVGVRGLFQRGHEVFVVMDLVAGRSLASLVKMVGPLHELVIRNFTKQITMALAYCHEHRCTHRDVKGLNILISTGGVARLCDFGSAKFMDPNEDKLVASEGYAYSPLWVAPETILTSQWTDRVDVWALGCVVVEMAWGRDPWAEKHFKSVFQATSHIAHSGELPALPATLSPTCREFVLACLTRDPAHRPSASDLLRHPFLAEEDRLAANQPANKFTHDLPTPKVQFSEQQQQQSAPTHAASAPAAMSSPAEASAGAADAAAAAVQLVALDSIVSSMATTMKLGDDAPSHVPAPLPLNGSALSAAICPAHQVVTGKQASFPPAPPPYPFARDGAADAMVAGGGPGASANAPGITINYKQRSSVGPLEAPLLPQDRPDVERNTSAAARSIAVPEPMAMSMGQSAGNERLTAVYNFGSATPSHSQSSDASSVDYTMRSVGVNDDLKLHMRLDDAHEQGSTASSTSSSGSSSSAASAASATDQIDASHGAEIKLHDGQIFMYEPMSAWTPAHMRKRSMRLDAATEGGDDMAASLTASVISFVDGYDADTLGLDVQDKTAPAAAARAGVARFQPG